MTMKEKVDGEDSEPVACGFANRVENVAALPKPVKRNQHCRSIPQFTVRQPVAFVVKKQHVIGFGHGGKIAQNHST